MKNTISIRKNKLLTVTKRVSNIPFLWKELSLAIEGRFTNLLIWISNEKSISEGCGKKMIYIRIDCFKEYSIPLTNKIYFLKDNEAINELLKFYKFGETTIDDLDRILDVTKNLKERECRNGNYL